MDALLKEIEELEKQTEGKPFVEEKPEEVTEVVEVETAETEEPTEVKTEASEKPAEESDEEKDKKAQEAYRERQRLKKEENEKRVAEALAAQKAEEERKALTAKYSAEEVSESDVLRQKLAMVDEIIMKDKVNSWRQNAETELNSLEEEFKLAFTDYDDVVSTALDITIDRMVQGGMSRRQAEEILRFEKLKIADAAAAKGQDPVEAVYKEGKAIVDWFESYAKKLGYEKTGKQPTKEKSLTAKAALREAAKPNAISGGKSATAVARDFDDLEDVSNLTIGQMMAGKF